MSNMDRRFNRRPARPLPVVAPTLPPVKAPIDWNDEVLMAKNLYSQTTEHDDVMATVGKYIHIHSVITAVNNQTGQIVKHDFDHEGLVVGYSYQYIRAGGVVAHKWGILFEDGTLAIIMGDTTVQEVQQREQ